MIGCSQKTGSVQTGGEREVISYAYNCMLVLNPKTAGTSMRDALADLWDDDWRGHQDSSGIYWHELPAKTRRRIGVAAFMRLYKFVFVRNPFDRMVSHYHYYQKSGNIFVDGYDTFTEWVKDERNLDKRFQNTTSQYLHWCSINGHNVMDYIGRFENLEADWREVLEQLGLDYRPLPVINASKHEHYSTYYDDETREIVTRRFKRDLDVFGYSFE